MLFSLKFNSAAAMFVFHDKLRCEMRPTVDLSASENQEVTTQTSLYSLNVTGIETPR